MPLEIIFQEIFSVFSVFVTSQTKIFPSVRLFFQAPLSESFLTAHIFPTRLRFCSQMDTASGLQFTVLKTLIIQLTVLNPNPESAHGSLIERVYPHFA
jgi:hypothetical protein